MNIPPDSKRVIWQPQQTTPNSVRDDFQITKHTIKKIEKGQPITSHLMMTNSQIQRYATNKVFIPYLHLSSPEYGKEIPIAKTKNHKFATSNSNQVDCQTAMEAIEKADLLSKFSFLEYNSLPNLCDFLKHAEMRGPNKSVSDAFRTFSPDSSKEIGEYEGSTCTGQSSAFVENLKEIGLKGFVVVERMNPITPPNHAAVIVPCTDGILFIEVLQPQFIAILKEGSESIPFVIEVPGKEGLIKEKIITSFKIIKTNEDYGIHNPAMLKSVTIIKKDGSKEVHHSEFLLRCPNKVPVMTRYMLAMKVYPLIAKGKNGDELRIKVNYDKGIVTLERESKDKKFSKVEIPFKIFNPKTLELDLDKEPDIKKRKELSEALNAFVGEGNTIETFWNEFHKPFKIKGLVFEAAKDESFKTMNELYTQVKRDIKQLEPPLS